MKLYNKIFLPFFCAIALPIFPQPPTNITLPDTSIPHSGGQYQASSIPKADYRNRLNLPAYDPSLMPLKTVRSGTGVWTELNPKVPRVDYLGIHFINKDTGWACGGNGALIKTTDGGKKWKWIELTTTVVLKTVGSFNGETVIAAGDNGTVLLSTDLGESWQTLNLNTTVNFWNVQFINENLVWLVGENGGCYKSTNGGYTWQLVTTPLGSLPHWDVDFLNANYGFICSDGGKVIKTTNGGNSWQLLQAGDDNTLYTIAIADSLNISAGGVMVKFVHSSDGGYTWTQSGLQGDPYINKIKFVNDSLGYATGLTTFPYRTTNQGRTWFAIGQNIGYWNITFTTGGVGFSVGNALKITKTTNSGFSWTQTIINDDFYDVHFVNETKGFAISGAFYKTTDGGINWERNYNAPGGYVITFTDSLTGFVGTTQSKIFKTTDGGQNWILTGITGLLDTVGRINDIFFLNKQLGWAVTTRGGIIKTTNAGDSWYAQFNGFSFLIFNKIFFVDSLLGWTSNTNRRPYKTTNGGFTWMEQIDLSFFSTRDVYFESNQKGWLITGNSGNNFYNTSDGGLNWINKIEIIDAFNFSFFPNIKRWLINGSQKYITTDGGDTWINITNDVPIGFNSFSAPTNILGFAVGSLGIILRYDDTTYIPVELISFAARIEKNSILLEWQTATEINNYGFQVEKSLDKKNWFNIGFVAGNGTSTNLNSYAFTDNEVSQHQFYRLKQIDYAGSFEYSNVIEVSSKINFSTFSLSQNHPNPFNSKTNIKVSVPSTTSVEIKVYNLLGKEIKTLLNEQKLPGEYDIEFDASNLTSGLYLYRMIAGEFVQTKKLIILK